MDVHLIKEMARLALIQASCQTISNQLACSKSTVQRYIQRLKAHNITLEQAITMSASSLRLALQLDTTVRCGYYCPDFSRSIVLQTLKVNINALSRLVGRVIAQVLQRSLQFSNTRDFVKRIPAFV